MRWRGGVGSVAGRRGSVMRRDTRDGHVAARDVQSWGERVQACRWRWARYVIVCYSHVAYHMVYMPRAAVMAHRQHRIAR